MTEFISGQKIYLRPVVTEDAQRCIDWLNDQETTKYTGHGIFPKKLNEEVNYINKAQFMLAIVSRETQRHVGNIEAYTIDSRTMSISIIVGEERGRGYGTEAVKLVAQHIFNRMPGINEIRAGMSVGNIASQKIFDKNGFMINGRKKAVYYVDGEYQDTISMNLLKKEWRKNND